MVNIISYITAHYLTRYGYTGIYTPYEIVSHISLYYLTVACFEDLCKYE